MRHVRIDPAEDSSRERPSSPYVCVRERMSTPAVTVAATAPVTEALRLMAAHRIHYLPVVADDGSLVGMVNADDVLGTRRPGKASGGAVAAVMSAPAVSVGPGVPLAEAMGVMADRQIGALPVVEDGHVIGILTQSDVVIALAREASP